MKTSPSRARRTLLAAAGVTAGCALALAVPLAASAHVEVSPATAPAGGTTRLTFQFHHGCDGSPTTALAIRIPAGVASTMPVYDGGWTIHRTDGADGLPTQVTFVARQPIPTDTSAAVSLDVLFSSSAAGKQISFPVVQTCEKGSTSWTQIPKTGQDPESLDTPAPTLAVGAKGVGDEDDVAHSSASPSASAEPQQTTSSRSDDQPDPVARWLAAGGLVAGIAALVVSVVRRRK
ncbi:hypothetical protein LK09_06810 [Microbacterium mangrovi]|uniref:YncI copper-binding domain-containing protein n=1 Tax=Microbacterium mangrovi TaxID=1348253 RepID=A0A0B2ABQ1_9MICO|nr:hypothetical protein LK09_06810 [Microbacterium mangrovi]